MRVQEKVLQLLMAEQGNYLSGERIASRLSVSRNAVWKAIQQLKKEGYVIEASTNRGYALSAIPDPISLEAIHTQLRGQAARCQIRYEKIVSSTNTVCKKLAEQGYPEGTVVLAEEQTAGKGRLGRSFYSPAQSGLYISVLLRPAFSAERALLITTAAAVAGARAIQAVTGKNAEIKWVNDLFYQEKKICGILTEASVDLENRGLAYAILGAGFNLRPPSNGFPEDIRDVAGALYAQTEPAPPLLRSHVTAEFLNEFFMFYQDLETKRFMEEYRQRSFLTGRPVTICYGQQCENGVVLGIDDDARLVIRLKNNTTRTYSAGEIQLRRDKA